MSRIFSHSIEADTGRRVFRVMTLLTDRFEFVRAAQDGIRRAARHEARLRLYISGSGRRPLENLQQTVSEQQIDGVIAYASHHRLIDAVQETGLPAINITGRFLDGPIPTVTADNAQVGRDAANHLLGLGLKSYCFTGGLSTISDRRRTGFLEGLAEAGMSAVDLGIRRGWEMMDDILALPQPLGMFCSTDGRGREMLNALENRGVPVPDRVAVVCGDNAPELCDRGDLSLSSVPPAGQDVGYRAAMTLLQMIDGQTPDFPILVPPRPVIQRDSTDVLACSDPAVVAAIRYLRAHACEGIDVSDVVRASGLSRSTVERRLRDVFGHSPHQEIRSLQLGRARMLLKETSRSIVRIAGDCGFDDPAYFTRVFRKHHDQTPAQFRQAHN